MAVTSKLIIRELHLAQLGEYKSTSFHPGVVVQEFVFCDPGSILEHRVCDVSIEKVHDGVVRG